MSLSPEWLDQLRARTSLASLIGGTVKLNKNGDEYKACCPFHHEKTPSFTVVEEKGFYHCFGCGAHGDAIRWMVDARGLAFMDAVKELAASAGIEVPARSPEAAKRDERVATAAETLGRAAEWYAKQLAGEEKVRDELAARGIGPGAIERFGLGFAPPRKSVAGCGAAQADLVTAGLLKEDGSSGLFRDHFRSRVMIPIHDGRGRIVGFAGRIHGPGEPKYINSPESDHFAKRELLFNLHRAAAAARSSRRLIVVEGQFDVVAMDAAGIEETVAPMGTALTERQLERAWRAAHKPVLLFDGDTAGRKAALRAAEGAMPHVGPGRSLAIGLLPEGEDPDSIIRSAETVDQGRGAIEAIIAAARPLDEWLWETLFAAADGGSPEGRAALWKRLAGLAGAIRDEDTRAQYLAEWRSRFDKAFPPAPPGLTDGEMAPDGEVVDLSSLGAAERASLESAAAAWFTRTCASPPKTAEAAGRWAWEIGRRVGAGLVDEAEVGNLFAAVSEANDALDADKLHQSFRFGKRRGGSLIRTMRLDRRCALFHRTDKGNSERWLARYSEDYLYTTAKGWLGWDGRRYRVLNQEKDTTPAEVLVSVVRTVEAIQREADFVRDTGWPEEEEIAPDLLAELEDDPRRPGGLDRLIREGKKPARLSDKLRAWALASEAAGRINCIPNLVKRDVTVELTEFDTDPMLLNCLNGTLRFMPPDDEGPARVDLKPHDRADRLTKLTACEYDPDAKAPEFQKLVRWAQPEVPRRRYLRQWMGYNLTGDMGEQIFHIWWGPSAANGKSTVGNSCREAIGDYGKPIKPEVFLEIGAKKAGDAATPAIVQLPGARMVTSGEPPKDTSIDEALINTITGGDPMQARDNFRSFFTFGPIFKWTLWCNRLPPIPKGTEGIWRRVKVMLWESHLEPDQRDRKLPLKLRAEYAGILAWMVRGAIDWMQNGFVEPESVTEASAAYKEDSDPLAVFLRTCTDPDPQARVQGSELYATFCAWAKAAGETEWKPKGFAEALKAKDIARKHSNGTQWLGLRLTKRPEDFVDENGNVRRLASEDDPPPASPHPYPVDDEDDDLPL